MCVGGEGCKTLCSPQHRMFRTTPATYSQMRSENTFVNLGTDLLSGREVAKPLDAIDASAEALLRYCRDQARERAAGSYAFFGEHAPSFPGGLGASFTSVIAAIVQAS